MSTPTAASQPYTLSELQWTGTRVRDVARLHTKDILLSRDVANIADRDSISHLLITPPLGAPSVARAMRLFAAPPLPERPPGQAALYGGVILKTTRTR